MSGTKTLSSPLWTLILCLVSGPAIAGPDLQPPPAQELLESSLNPEVAFKGRMMVTHWFGRQTTAEEVEVYHAPPNLYRREYISPEGTVQRVQISDGDVEQNFLVRQNKTISGDAVKSYEKVMSAEREMELLLKNYELSVSTKADEVAGRKAWILELKPLVSGKSWQRLWIDQQAGLILENKKFLPKHHYAVLSRYSKVEIQKQVNPKLFELTVSSTDINGTGHGLEPDFMTLEELKKATGKNPAFPADLPEGFAFESADFFPYGTHVVLHARYTDGLAVLSLFQTDLPVRIPKGGTATVAPPTKGGGAIRLSTVGNVLNWKRGGQYFTLMGDVTKELLQSISAKLK